MSRTPVRIAALLIAIPLVFAPPALAQSCPTDLEMAGSWRWVESQTGKEGEVVDPASLGFDVILELGLDGSARLRVDDRTLEGSYESTCVPHTHTARFRLIGFDLKLERPLEALLRRPHRLSLGLLGQFELQPECLDCPFHSFVRDAPNRTPVESLGLGAWKALWSAQEPVKGR